MRRLLNTNSGAALSSLVALLGSVPLTLTAQDAGETLPSTTVNFGTPEAIDGVIEDAWSTQPVNSLTVDIDGSMPEASNLSGYWQAMWDDDYLYFLLVTEDDTIVTWPGSQFWNNDMTELFLDMDYSRNDDVTRYDENDSQTVFPRDGQEPFANGATPFTFPLANFAQVTDGTTTVVELALPWTELGVTPANEMPFGVDVYMKDADAGAGRENQISWSPSRDVAWKHPALFGTAILAGRPPVTTINYGAPDALDGAIEDVWAEQPINNLTIDIDGTMPEATDISGYWQAMWDRDYLYFLFVAEDDTVVTFPGSSFWNFDMTELFLDMDYSRNDDIERYDENDFQTVFPRDGQEAFRNGPSPLSFPLTNYVQVTEGTTTIIEVALPWSDLTVTPENDMRIGVDVYMKDSDDGARREGQIAWSPSRDEAWKHPALFGTAILAGAPPLTTIAYGTPEAVDGTIEEAWGQQPVNTLGVDIDGTSPEASNLSGYWQSMWDEEFLYFLLVAEDDVIADYMGSRFWNFDMTELFLDVDYSRNDDVERYDVFDSQIVFPRDGDEVFINGPSSLTAPFANFAQVRDGTMTIVEVALPWSELGVAPFIGMPIGVDVYMKDNDEGESRDNQISWSPSNDEAWKHPALFGTATLIGLADTPTAYATAGAPLAIDGMIDSGWLDANSYTLGVDIDGTAPATDNLSGSWRAMWDEAYLYLMLVTQDDVIVEWPGSQFWNNDMTELFLDADYSRNDDVSRYDGNDSQTVFPRDGQDPFGNGDSPFTFPIANFAQVTASGTTTIELALPWSELGVSPYAGRPLGFDVYMKDNDEGTSRDNQIAWSPSRDQAWRHPALFGTLILADGFAETLASVLQAAPQAGATFRSTWFGSYFQADNWINHAQLGWLFTADVTSEDDLMMWSYPLGGFVWSTRDDFPFVYDFNTAGWVYYLVLEEGGVWVYDLGLGEWSQR